MDVLLSELASKVKAACTVREVAAWFGYDYTCESADGLYPCPACESVSKSKRTLRVYSDDRCHCFHCDETRDVIGWLAAKLGVRPREAIQTLASKLGIEGSSDLVSLVKHKLFPSRLSELRSDSVGDVEARAVLSHLAKFKLRYRNELGLDHLLAWVHLVRLARQPKVSLRRRAVAAAQKFASGPVRLADRVARVAASDRHLRLAYFADVCRGQLLADRGPYRRMATTRGWLSEDAALFKVGAYTKPGSFWSGRILFPVYDPFGRCVAFAGRLVDPAIADKPKAKYINSADSEVFHKKQELYGLHKAATAIIASGYAVVVEGYADVIACHTNDVPQAVAAMGSRVSPSHAEQLAVLCDTVVLIGDGDDAGKEAMAKWSVVCRAARLGVLRLNLPRGADPDNAVARLRGAIGKALADRQNARLDEAISTLSRQ